MAASGAEIIKHRKELEAVLLKIATDHVEQCAQKADPCNWKAGWIDRLIRNWMAGAIYDLDAALEEEHVRLSGTPSKSLGMAFLDYRLQNTGVPEVSSASHYS